MNDIPKHCVFDAAALLAAAATLGAIAAPATAQVVVPTLKMGTKLATTAPVSRNITFKGSEAQARARAAGLQSSDPIQAKLLTSAIDAAKGRPGFNPAALSVAVGFTMRFREAGAGALVR
ncbi:plastocyanin [Sphingomonas sp. UYAg733]